ncbi:MAG: hypothetical protein FJ010_13190 [Chloroflexi bacterium]|nr:hypothetical protein [Chloroflexota bacterium]
MKPGFSKKLGFWLSCIIQSVVSFVDRQRLFKARLLVSRLERLSADSIWARRASGVRASLHKALARLDEAQGFDVLDTLIEMGFDILEKAAQEVPDSDERLRR